MPGSMPDQEALRQALRQVVDPEVGINVVDLGLIYGIEIGEGAVRVAMTMTTPACPVGPYLAEQAAEHIRAIVPPGTGVTVDLVWEPPWHPGLMSEAAKGRFGWSGN
jgi:metal-sulfur cluster biosynthetic enzyme